MLSHFEQVDTCDRATSELVNSGGHIACSSSVRDSQLEDVANILPYDQIVEKSRILLIDKRNLMNLLIDGGEVHVAPVDARTVRRTRDTRERTRARRPIADLLDTGLAAVSLDFGLSVCQRGA